MLDRTEPDATRLNEKLPALLFAGATGRILGKPSGSSSRFV